MIITLWLLSLTAVAEAQQQQDNVIPRYDGCFRVWTGYKTNCLLAGHHVKSFTEKECRHICMTFPANCLSFDYDRESAECQLYSRRIVDSTSGADSNVRPDLPAIDIAKGNPEDMRFCLRLGPHLIASANVVHYSSTGWAVCSGFEGQNTSSWGVAKNNPAGFLCTPISSEKRLITAVPATQSAAGRGSSNRPWSQFHTLPHIPTTVAPGLTTEMLETRIIRKKKLPAHFCHDANVSSAFIEMPSVVLADHDDMIVLAESASHCTQMCAENLFVPCASAEYHNDTKDCMLSAERLYPNGDGVPNLVANATYLEKVCLNSSVADQCRGPFIKRVQMILLGSAHHSLHTADFNECLRQCVHARVNGEFDCRSGMIFYNDDNFNCILNIIDQHTDPHIFVASDRDLVDYFEINC